MSGIYIGNFEQWDIKKQKDVTHTHITSEERKRHTYIVGSAGSGKTELLKVLIHHHATKERSSIVVIDAHTDLCEQVALWPDPELQGRIVYLKPNLLTNMMPMLNPFTLGKDASDRTKEKISNRLAELIGDICRGAGSADMSVRMINVAKVISRVLLDIEGASFIEFFHLLDDEPPANLYVKGLEHPDPMIARFFRTEIKRPDYAPSRSAMRARLLNLILHKDFTDIACNPDSIPLFDLVEDGKIVLFSLGNAGGETAQIIGKMVLSLLAIKGDLRKDVERTDRQPVHVFVDECHNFMGPSVNVILKEMRKYGIHLTLANQYVTDFTKDEQNAVLSNCFIKMMGPTDAPGPMLQAMGLKMDDMHSIENRQFWVKWGQHQRFILKVRSDLADDSRRLDGVKFSALKLKQRRYYVPAELKTLDTPEDGLHNVGGEYEPDFT